MLVTNLQPCSDALCHTILYQPHDRHDRVCAYIFLKVPRCRICTLGWKTVCCPSWLSLPFTSSSKTSTAFFSCHFCSSAQRAVRCTCKRLLLPLQSTSCRKAEMFSSLSASTSGPCPYLDSQISTYGEQYSFCCHSRSSRCVPALQHALQHMSHS